LADSRARYEHLFYLLQSQPCYLAALVRLVDAKNAPSLVQTVVFDLFGDQYDTRQERLLLSLFSLVLRAEFEQVH
jgi:Ras GTPase-activating-like protein IQGAP2/3